MFLNPQFKLEKRIWGFNFLRRHKYGPYLLYYLSIDIIDSTRFKTTYKNKKESSSSWSHQFKIFFEDVDKYLTKAYRNYNDTVKVSFPFKWRIIGDEIVYFSEIYDIQDILGHVLIAINFIKEFNSMENPLKIKISSWLAGFPVNNALFYTKDEKELRKNNRQRISNYETINFLGPYIDAGFRIANYSTINKYVISVDLALVLLILKNKEDTGAKELEFYFDKEKLTKGINKGKYPIIWINIGSDDSITFLLEKSNPCCATKLSEYCKDYMKKHDIYVPFIFEKEDTFFKPSKKYELEYDKVIQLLEFNEQSYIEDENRIDTSGQNKLNKIDMKDIFK